MCTVEEELELAMAVSRTLGDEDSAAAETKPVGVPADLLERVCPQMTYAEAVKRDRHTRGGSSHLPGDSTCAVCQGQMSDEDDVRLFPCRHAFHVGCCDPWLQRSTCCPTCRADVTCLNLVMTCPSPPPSP